MMAFYTQFKRNRIKGIKAEGGLTKQSSVGDADINLILKKYNLSRIPPPTTPPIYADQVIMPKSLEEAISVIENAQQWFLELPAEVRQTFGNDPVNALELVTKDLPLAIKKGLIPALEPQIIEKAAKAATPEPSTTTTKTAKGAEAPVESEPEPEA